MINARTTPSKSYYSFEDLQSNFRGAEFGASYGHLEGEQFYDALGGFLGDYLSAAEPSASPVALPSKAALARTWDVQRNETYTPSYAPGYQDFVTGGGLTKDQVEASALSTQIEEHPGLW